MEDDPITRPALDAPTAAGGGTPRERLFREVVDSMDTGILVVDGAGRIIECNAAAERALGYEPGGVLGRTAEEPHWNVVDEHGDAVLPEDHPGPRCLRTGEPVTAEVLGVHGADGERRWFRVEALPLRDGGDDLLGVAVLFDDITEQRRIADELAQTEKRLALAREAAAMGLWEWDVRSGSVWHDEGVAGILAGSVASMDEWLAHVHPDDRDRVAEQAAAVLEGRSARDQQYRVVALDGEEKYVVSRGVVVEWDGSRPVRIAGSIVDSTRLREATEQAQHLLDRMTDAYFVVDEDWCFSYVNAQAERLLGLTRDQMVGRSVWDLFPDAVGGEFERQYRLAMGGQPVEFEAYYLGLDAWYEVRAHPVRNAIAVYFRDVSARHRDAEVQDALLRATQAAKAELAYAASHDSLTDLPNRPASAAWLAEHLAAAARPESVAVLYVDLDRFKLVNDTHGHAEGDELLVEAAARLRALSPPDGFVARLGGDEFVLACPDTNRGRAHGLAAEVLEAFRSPFQVSGRWLVVTASIGIAFGDSASTPTTVLRDADAALYQAKDAGRNRVGVFDDEVRQQVVDRLHIEADLRDALNDGDLFAHVQPMFDARTGDALGVEVLARWHHAERGMVAPDEFIPVAEETGLIVPLGERMLDEAFSLFGPVDEALGRRGTVWVNVSARQLEEPGFVDGLLARVEAHGDRNSFGIEITERVLLMNARVGQGALRELAAAGVKVAIDDFGTGYSSFARLGLYPVDLLKVDRSFIASAGSPRGRAMTAAIIELAHALGAEACAEGVETTEQLAVLRELGVDQVSGYLLCRPGPLDALAAGAQAAARVLTPIAARR